MRRAQIQRQGMTVTELLSVLMILGILSGILFAQYTVTRQLADINSAARQLQADLQGVRDAALRQTLYGLLSVSEDGRSYTVSSCKVAAGTDCLNTRTRTVPGTALLYTVTSGGSPATTAAERTVTYTPPDGEQPNADGYRINVTSSLNPGQATVRLVGLTGKAVVDVAR